MPLGLTGYLKPYRPFGDAQQQRYLWSREMLRLLPGSNLHAHPRLPTVPRSTTETHLGSPQINVLGTMNVELVSVTKPDSVRLDVH
jgi:hypothetical protein